MTVIASAATTPIDTDDVANSKPEVVGNSTDLLQAWVREGAQSDHSGGAVGIGLDETLRGRDERWFRAIAPSCVTYMMTIATQCSQSAARFRLDALDGAEETCAPF